MTTQSRIELLQQMAVFGALRTDVLEFLLDQSRLVTVAGGAYFFREGEPGEAMYVLESGRVEVVKQVAEGEWRVLRQFGAGDCFGEMALMDLAPRSASVRAIEDCCAIEIGAGQLMSIYRKDIEQFVLLEMNMGRELSRRLREADEQLFRKR